MALNNRQIANGYVILCVARAKSRTSRWRSAWKAMTGSIATRSSTRWNPMNSRRISPRSKPERVTGRSGRCLKLDIDHIYDYDPAWLAEILRVGEDHRHGRAPARTRPSSATGCCSVLHETGYDMIPVNPNPKVTEIRGIKVYRSFAGGDRPPGGYGRGLPPQGGALWLRRRQAIAIGAKVLWGQIGVYDDKCRPKLAEEAGLKVVMNRCPKIELFRPFWKPRLDLEI